MNVPKTLNVPFAVEGAPNVVLDTIKRSDDEDFTKTEDNNKEKVVILRLYEAFGGHAQAKLRIGGGLHVSKATLTNLLEDELENLKLTQDSGGATSVMIGFRGFQVVTVKLTVTVSSSSSSSSDKQDYPTPVAQGE